MIKKWMERRKERKKERQEGEGCERGKGKKGRNIKKKGRERDNLESRQQGTVEEEKEQNRIR